MKIGVFIPVLNARSWCDELVLLPGLQYFASDSGSTDGSAETLEEKGVCVIRQRNNLGRVGNWHACVELFAKSECEWMKWLFAGDKLPHDAFRIYSNAIEAAPEAHLIVGDFVINEDGNHLRIRRFPELQIFEPSKTLEYAAECSAGAFGPPIAHLLNRAALPVDWNPGPLSWIADQLLCMAVGRKGQVAYVPEIFGTFEAAARKFYSANAASYRTALEMTLLRLEALALRRAMPDGDVSRLEEVERHIIEDVTESAIRRSVAPGDAAWSVVASTPTKQLIALFARKAKRSLAWQMSHWFNRGS